MTDTPQAADARRETRKQLVEGILRAAIRLPDREGGTSLAFDQYQLADAILAAIADSESRQQAETAEQLVLFEKHQLVPLELRLDAAVAETARLREDLQVATDRIAAWESETVGLAKRLDGVERGLAVHTVNHIDRESVASEFGRLAERVAALELELGILPPFDSPKGQALRRSVRERPAHPEPFEPHNPNIPAYCVACGRPILLENLYCDDGCPCNSPRGVNFTPQPCDICKMDNCVKPGHRLAQLWDNPVAERPPTADPDPADHGGTEAVASSPPKGKGPPAGASSVQPAPPSPAAPSVEAIRAAASAAQREFASLRERGFTLALGIDGAQHKAAKAALEAAYAIDLPALQRKARAQGATILRKAMEAAESRGADRAYRAGLGASEWRSCLLAGDEPWYAEAERFLATPEEAE